MQIKNLIDRAKDASAKSLGQLAADMHVKQSAITAWKKGDYRPGPSQIIYLAECAKIPALETLAEIESEANPDMAGFWKKAVRELRQNQG
ncbi:MAG: helix-turn-helix transcriptional regulator [Rhodoferax sp.]|uniref:helix-turn-helix domain-containing protein n=1 Tax=Rhodoferax sp. TaxID=50421 RepID=UPI0027184EFF|nr:helix-turn-helix transcriptional regulator [Rhodoferax sp.]MDO8447536.1 helix-turn-helix transcriptional regulator [Rhodoferax sp.]